MNTCVLDDLTLVKALKKNSREAHDKLVARYGQMVFAVIARTVQDVRDAEELTQDTLLAAMLHINRFNPRRSHLSTWLRTIACNKAASFNRRVDTPVIPIEDIKDEWSAITEEQIELELSDVSEDNIQRLRQAVLSLLPDERMLISLYYFDSMSISDIALTTNTTIQIIYRKLFNVRRKLYDILTK
ncbi:MAG: sigma-70 family RNA polymerase sigma factor [Bacteroidaceae bacterium]|nr:sigma-70 family RNA polymerase sigma factor [Bacteroidaceae bacterium]